LLFDVAVNIQYNEAVHSLVQTRRVNREFHMRLS
jgi:hypothetical protein